VYAIQTTYLELMHSHPYYFLFTQFFDYNFDLFLLVENLIFFVLLVLSFFSHVHVHGQCSTTAKYNLIRLRCGGAEGQTMSMKLE